MSVLSVAVDRRLGGFRLEAAFEAGAGVTAVFGASGSGKSTLLAAIAGALRPDRGRIVADGRVLFDSTTGVDLAMEARAIGWVFQDARLFPHLSVESNLRYGLTRARERPHALSLGEVAEVLGLQPLLARRPRDLSGGERQRVAVGRALLSQPRLLLMDEPLSALDAPLKAEILPFLDRLKARAPMPIVYVTHAFSEVMRLADRLVVLEAGRVAAQGPLGEVLARPDLPLLAGRADAAAALETVVSAHHPERGLTRLQAAGTDLLIPLIERPLGARVRAVVLARDVMIAREEPKALSARNVLPVRIERLQPRADGSVLVTLAFAQGDERLLSAVTRDAVDALALAPGAAVWAVLKSVAVEGAQAGGLLAALDD